MISEFLKISESDLKASEILYKEKLYSHSVYFFQQSIEKANKTLGLISRIITEKDLRDISHRQLQIHIKLVEGQLQKLKNISKNAEKLPKLKEFIISENIDSEKIYSEIEKEQFKLKNIEKMGLKLVYLSEPQIKEIIELIKKFLKEAEEYPKTDNLEESLNKIKTDAKKILDLMYEINPIEAAKLEKEFNQITNEMWNEIIDIVLDYITLSNRIFLPLIYLAIITLPHSEASRYPDRINLLEVYNENLPIVKFLPELFEIQKEVLSNLNKLLEISQRKI